MGPSTCPGSAPTIMAPATSRAWTALNEFLGSRAKPGPKSTTTLGSTSSIPVHTTAKLATSHSKVSTTAINEYSLVSSTDSASDTLGTRVPANTCECFHVNGEHSSFSKTVASTTKCPTKPHPTLSTPANALFYHTSKSLTADQPNGHYLKPIISRSSE
ncbi:unnamed protein product [Pleuronectes platessa]|uniref:Uncharacterized protein n=1 Tax=Pleuronectes platessa TaxID=8262 RepID=A0A9N7YMB4_PLEPL|nr:unnamed protein product [Pleuronectes platessa]